MPGWSSEEELNMRAVCTHVWSREMGVHVRRKPYLMSICTWCGRMRARAVDPTKLQMARHLFGEEAA